MESNAKRTSSFTDKEIYAFLWKNTHRMPHAKCTQAMAEREKKNAGASPAEKVLELAKESRIEVKKGGTITSRKQTARRTINDALGKVATSCSSMAMAFSQAVK